MALGLLALAMYISCIFHVICASFSLSAKISRRKGRFQWNMGLKDKKRDQKLGGGGGQRKDRNRGNIDEQVKTTGSPHDSMNLHALNECMIDMSVSKGLFVMSR